MTWKEKLEQVMSRFDVKTYGYKVNKWLTNAAFILIVLYAVFVVRVDGFDVLTGKSWVECPAENPLPCLNPLYDKSCHITGSKCEPEYLMQGEVVGQKPSVYANNFGTVMFLLFGSALLLNHLLYNRGWKVKKID